MRLQHELYSMYSENVALFNVIDISTGTFPFDTALMKLHGIVHLPHEHHPYMYVHVILFL